jgi:branched-chain amino acid transport system substrate-binding protein
MTNDLAAVGDTPYGVITAAIDAYLQKANEEDGGACGRNVVLLAEDDQHSADLALAKTKKLVEEDQVLAIIGGLDTSTHAAVAAYLNDPNADGSTADGIPDLFLADGWSGWGEAPALPWTVGYLPDYRTDARVQTSYINQHLAGKKIGVLHKNDEFGADYFTGVQASVAAVDLLVSEQTYDPAAPDLRLQVIALRDAGAEAIVVALSAKATAEAIKMAKEEAYAPAWFISNMHSPSALARELGGGIQPEQLASGFQLLDGAISTTYLLSTIEDSETPAMLEHKRIMETYGGPEAISTLSVYGQSVAALTIETLSRACDDLTRAGVLRAAESIRGFRSSLLAPGINISLSPKDHYAIQTLQPVRIQADGTVTELGDPISLEASTVDDPFPSPTASP